METATKKEKQIVKFEVISLLQNLNISKENWLKVWQAIENDKNIIPVLIQLTSFRYLKNLSELFLIPLGLLEKVKIRPSKFTLPKNENEFEVIDLIPFGEKCQKYGKEQIIKLTEKAEKLEKDRKEIVLSYLNDSESETVQTLSNKMKNAVKSSKITVKVN
jgi:hypothetical protein